MLPLITTQNKDALLQWLCASIRVGATTDINPEQAKQELEVS